MNPWWRRRREQTAAELQEEIQSHLEMEAEEQHDRGISLGQASAAARRKFGNVTAAKEIVYEMDGWGAWESLVQDVRHSLRNLARSPQLVLITALSLGLGMGVNTTLFSVMKSLFFAPPSAAHPEQLVRIWVNNTNRTPWPNYQAARSAGVLQDLAGYRMSEFNLKLGGTAERQPGMEVTGNFFDVLATGMGQGRGFSRAEDAPAANPASVIISHGFWQRRLGGEPDVVGRALVINGQVMTIIGVLPQDYRSIMHAGLTPDLYVPFRLRNDRALMEPDRPAFELLGRLKPEMTSQQAQAALLTVLQNRPPMKWQGKAQRLTVRVFAASWPEALRAEGMPIAAGVFAVLLLVLASLVLLIACANVAGLLLARAVTRQREIAVRLALGASRSRVVRHLLTESLLLALGGTASGLLLREWAAAIIPRLPLPSPAPIVFRLETDWTLAGYAALLTLLAALFCGLTPALQATRRSLAPALKQTTGQTHRRRITLRNVLVVGQVAISLVLLVVSALFVRSLQHVGQVNPGFDTAHLMTLTPSFEPNRYDGPQTAAIRERLKTRLLQVPGVMNLSDATLAPLSGTQWTEPVQMQGSSLPDAPAQFNAVGPGYFATMGIALRHGREFQAGDRAGAPRVVIVNEAFVQRFLPGQNALGRQMQFPFRREGPQSAEIVGVVVNYHLTSLGEIGEPAVFESGPQASFSPSVMQVRTAVPPATLRETLRRAALEVDPSMAVEVKTMDEAIEVGFFLRRLSAAILGAIGLLGLLLATIGLYGVVAYSVSRRVPEIGLRMALGASRRSVMRLVLRDGLTLVGAGVVAGLVLSAAATRPLASLLVGVGVLDPVALGSVSVLLLIVGLAASYGPARRATRVDPLVALRYE